MKTFSLTSYSIQLYLHKPETCTLIRLPWLTFQSTLKSMPSSGLSNIVLRRLHQELDRHNAMVSNTNDRTTNSSARLLATENLIRTPAPSCNHCGFKVQTTASTCPGCGDEQEADGCPPGERDDNQEQHRSSSRERCRSSSPVLPRVGRRRLFYLPAPTELYEQTARILASPQRAPTSSQETCATSPIIPPESNTGFVSSLPWISPSQLERIDQNYRLVSTESSPME